MHFFEIFFIGVGLAMDAFAVSICKGLSMKRIDYKKCFIIAFYFSLFQMLMPLMGYFLGSAFENLIVSIDHWIAFIMLFMIGLNMIKEAFSQSEETNEKIDFRTMLPLAIATSIDALAVGITFAFLRVNLLLSIITIGIVTFVITFMGVIIGNKVGNKFEKASTILGGIILIFIGIKILLEHLSVL